MSRFDRCAVDSTEEDKPTPVDSSTSTASAEYEYDSRQTDA
ncbi:hypothetical protein [Stieleria sedimenti]|nr:hypothetical protein [Stieleria sedimenti]